MRVLSFTSQKGGSGKTTLSAHIAVQAERAGAGPVALIDTDPQGSLADWWNVRESSTPAFVQTMVAKLAIDFQQLRRLGIRVVVIDTPPAITATIQHVIALSDLVVIPTRPSPHDLRAAGATVDLASRAQKPMVFVINAAMAKARITAEAAIALSQHGTLAPVTVHQRTEYATSMIDGRTVMELAPDGAACAEMEQLWGYLSDRMGRVAPRQPAQVRAPLLTRGRGFGRRMAVNT